MEVGWRKNRENRRRVINVLSGRHRLLWTDRRIIKELLNLLSDSSPIS